MIVILEGLEGVGKTEAAQHISRTLGLPIYRAFRSNPYERFGEGNHIEAMLRKLGVPINTHVEDLYVADLLTTIGGDVILDRSMPSGYAYALWDALLDESEAKKALDYWLWRMSARSDVHYIDMVCDPDIASIRAPGRTHYLYKRTELRRRLDECYNAAQQRFHAVRIDTSDGGVTAMLEGVSKHLGKGDQPKCPK